MRVGCPFLPSVDRVWRAGEMSRYRSCRKGEFYLATLCYAQSLLLEGKPGQALLQINKSFSADFDDGSLLEQWPPGYAAVVWIIRQHRLKRDEEGFLGNPVRHYQHLATRMSGPRAEIRAWRAWACFHLAREAAPEFPLDREQIQREGLVIPGVETVFAAIEDSGWEGEADVLRGTWDVLERGKDYLLGPR